MSEFVIVLYMAGFTLACVIAGAIADYFTWGGR